MVVKNSYKHIVRGATAPFTLKLKTNADLADWKITFTLRKEITGTGHPLIAFDNTDARMVVSGNTVGVVLSSEDTYNIPENVKVIFIQLILEKDGVVDTTWIYSIGVLPNLLPEEKNEGGQG